MSLVEHLLRDRTPLELAKMLKVEAEANAALRERVARLQTELFWLVAEKSGKPDTYGGARVYENATAEMRAQVDAAIATADGLMAAARESRDRRKVDIPYQASGMPDRRQSDRRSRARKEGKS